MGRVFGINPGRARLLTRDAPIALIPPGEITVKCSLNNTSIPRGSRPQVGICYPGYPEISAG
jgi:hypothetical protein